ncbi:MAG: bifunctional UDP-N-acetylmuramoyl-tripeptide:D-alanyl-D-alanine ligase/alanine racemase [Bacteroidaceae bacterium]
MLYTIKEIAKIIQAARSNLYDCNISWILTDSRSLCFPDETLFFALKTSRNDGSDYIKELHQRGVRNFVVSCLPENIADYAESNFLLVKDTLVALQTLAASHRSKFTIPVIGITGSNGKTVVKEWLNQLLSPDRHVVRSPRSYNSQIGVALSIWQLNKDANIGVFEAGISQVDEMSRLQPMIQPTIGVLTNIGGAHQENFSSMTEKCLEKIELFKNCEVLIYDADDDLIRDCVSRSMFSSREIAWSREDRERPLFINEVAVMDTYTHIVYTYLGMRNEFDIPFIDDASLQNALHCLGVCLYLMFTPEQITERMAKLEPVAMRLEVKEGKLNNQLINDSYNSDLGSLDIALDFLYRRSMLSGMPRTLILSDILESGHSSGTLYRRVSQLLKERKVDVLIGIGSQISAYGEVFHQKSYFFDSTRSFLNSELIHSLNHQTILVKGARVFQFEQIIEQLELKRHETILEVNLSNVIANYNRYKDKLTHGVKMIAMVKASAYGAGTVEIAKTLQMHHVDYLAVALADEGAELREAGITTDIMVMNPELTTFRTLFNQRLEPEVYSFEMLDALMRFAQHAGVAQFPIHIKLNTGMNRLGFDPQDIDKLIDRLRGQNALVPRSIFSHFVGADEVKFDDFTRKQIKLFDETSSKFIAAFNHKILRHICNTAGITRFPEAHFDMVRLGLGLYGIDSVNNELLDCVCTLTSTILQIHDLEPDETVGYGRKGSLTKKSKVAAIPIGYADGVNRHLGNRHGYCLVNNQPAPYVGNICMDIAMIDVTDIDCKVGDPVEIFGEKLPVTKLAEWLDTIPYEVFTSMSSRVKRICFQE